MKTLVGTLLLLGAGLCLAAEPDRVPPIEAVTSDGVPVRLFPNGRWAFVDTARAEAARKVAADYPENQVRSAEAQGGLFGVGRTLMPGDKDYNRGSLNPKLR